MGFDFKKFLASGTKPVEQRGKGARPKGSPEPTVFKGPQDKKKKIVEKSNQFSKAVEKSQKKAKEKKDRNRTNFSSKNLIQKNTSKVKKNNVKLKTNLPTYSQIQKTKNIQDAKDLFKGSNLTPVFTDKKTGKLKAAVTREDLIKKGYDPNKKSSLTKYLNELNKQNVTIAKQLAENKSLEAENKAKGLPGSKTGGITKRRFGGIAIKGVKDPNKIFKG